MLKDYPLLMTADGLPKRPSLRNLQRCARRVASRCWVDKASIQLPRVFCQNSGACGSTYLVQLLVDNEVQRCFHELAPDLNQLGIDHFESPLDANRLIRLLRYTRHDVFFEASNRLFSFSIELNMAFPNARFIHLHRHPADSVSSAMSKPDVSAYLAENLRFQGSLAGDHSLPPFERFCHYWNNVNKRILADLSGQDFMSFKFKDLVAGSVDSLEDFLERSLPVRSRPTVNQGTVRSQGRFPRFENWTSHHQQTLKVICGKTMEQLGYGSFS